MSGLTDYVEVEPIRSLSALLAFGAAVIAGAAFNQDWSGEAVAQIGGVWSGFIALVGTFFARGSVTPNAKVDQKVHDTIVELSPLVPPAPPA